MCFLSSHISNFLFTEGQNLLKRDSLKARAPIIYQTLNIFISETSEGEWNDVDLKQWKAAQIRVIYIQFGKYFLNESLMTQITALHSDALHWLVRLNKLQQRGPGSLSWSVMDVRLLTLCNLISGHNTGPPSTRSRTWVRPDPSNCPPTGLRSGLIRSVQVSAEFRPNLDPVLPAGQMFWSTLKWSLWAERTGSGFESLYLSK